MKTITIGSKTMELRANPLALLYYQQAFKKDLLVEFTGLREIVTAVDPSNLELQGLDTIKILQMVWAMNKAAQPFGSTFPGFEEWISSLESIDFGDFGWFATLMEVGVEGFFPSAGIAQGKEKIEQ